MRLLFDESDEIAWVRSRAAVTRKRTRAPAISLSPDLVLEPERLGVGR
jgi:hypothetical protein